MAHGASIRLSTMDLSILSKNKTAEQIAEELEEEITDIQKIYDVAEKFAPEYNVNKIFETMNPNI